MIDIDLKSGCLKTSNYIRGFGGLRQKMATLITQPDVVLQNLQCLAKARLKQQTNLRFAFR